MRVHIGVGSNLPTAHGSPRATVLAAARRLAARVEASSWRSSRVYRSEPVGIRAQPDFANSVVEIDTRHTPAQLFAALREIEAGFGRERGDPGGARRLDLDFLLAGSLCLRTADLMVPHPRLHQRRFVLVPLVEIAPAVVHPALGRRAAELLADCRDRSWVEPWLEEPAPSEATG